MALMHQWAEWAELRAAERTIIATQKREVPMSWIVLFSRNASKHHNTGDTQVKVNTKCQAFVLYTLSLTQSCHAPSVIKISNTAPNKKIAK